MKKRLDQTSKFILKQILQKDSVTLGTLSWKRPLYNYQEGPSGAALKIGQFKY